MGEVGGPSMELTLSEVSLVTVELQVRSTYDIVPPQQLLEEMEELLGEEGGPFLS